MIKKTYIQFFFASRNNFKYTLTINEEDQPQEQQQQQLLWYTLRSGMSNKEEQNKQ